jgi:4-hydroxy-tetrahydrodipicolinate synthase
MSPVAFVPEGVIPAILLPFADDLAIDERSLRRHLDRVCATEGLSAVTVNGHSSEMASCSIDEQERVLSIAAEQVGGRLPVICGVYATGSQAAARVARMAERAGAAALLVFPPEPFINGVQSRPEMAFAHYSAIAEASSLPLIHFQYSLATGQGLLLDDLLELVERVPSIVAIKDWAGDPQLHERHIRTLGALPRPVRVLTTHSAWLLSSLVLGAAGLLSGSGSVIADRHVALFEAIQRNDLSEARRVWDSIHPLAEVFYSTPWGDMHNRMKWALHRLGELASPAVRPPLVQLPEHERAAVEAALAAADLRLPTRTASG